MPERDHLNTPCRSNQAWFLVLLLLAIASAPQSGCKRAAPPSSGAEETTDRSIAIDVVDEPGAFDETDWPFRRDEVRAWAADIAPMVEDAADREFLQPLRIRLVDRTMLSESLERELAPQYEKLMGVLTDDETIGRQLAWMSELMSVAILGKYGFSDRTLYLVPSNLELITGIASIEEEHHVPIAKLVIAHELTHALQDQHLGLHARIEAIRDAEESQAFSATIEGHAILVQDEVGGALGIEESAREFARLFSAGALQEDGLMPDNAAMKMLASQFDQIYLGGRDFVAFHREEGGNERVWEILENPPGLTSMIADPSSYSSKKIDQPIDLASLLADLESSFVGRSFQRQEMPLGEMMVRSSLVLLDSEKIEAIVAGFNQGRVLILRESSTGTLYIVGAIEFTSDEAARLYCEASEEVFGRQMREMKERLASIEYSPINADELPESFGTFDLSEAGLTQRAHLGMHALTGGVGETEILRAQAESLVFEAVALNDDDFAEDHVIDAARRVFARYREQMAN